MTETAFGRIPGWWGFVSTLSFVPVAALLHHAVFYQRSCMLNPFGDAYTLSTLRALIVQDPSIGLAAAVAASTYVAGRRWPQLKPMASFFVLSFLPLAIWLWDIPLLGRPICRHFHDGRAEVLGSPFSSRHLYLLGLVSWATLSAWWWQTQHRQHRA